MVYRCDGGHTPGHWLLVFSGWSHVRFYHKHTYTWYVQAVHHSMLVWVICFCFFFLNGSGSTSLQVISVVVNLILMEYLNILHTNHLRASTQTKSSLWLQMSWHLTKLDHHKSYRITYTVKYGSCQVWLAAFPMNNFNLLSDVIQNGGPNLPSCQISIDRRNIWE